ncbi:hypothetical protein CCH79_00013202, partial [Gambusia affinis]
DRYPPFPARRLRRRHAAPRSSRCKSSSPPGQSGRLLPPPTLGPDGSLFPGSWMNDRRVVNKCEKNAEAPRSASPAPSTEDETQPELWTTMEGTSLYLPIVILLMQCSPSLPVTVSTNRPKVEVEEFSDAELSCLFHTERDPNPRIEWKKKAKEVSFVYFDGRFRGPFEGRATIDGATVTLHRVTQEDAGEYRCEISASLDTVSLGETNVTLNVLVPPQTPTCEVPASAVTGSAEFKAVTKDDSGRYSCLASNGVGSPKMCEAKHMTIEDVNITVILGSVVVVFLLLVVCGCGGMLLHRNGLLSRRLPAWCAVLHEPALVKAANLIPRRSFWISQCHGAAHISSQTLHRADDT